MVSIEVLLAPARPYSNDYATLTSDAQTLRFDLQPGSHTAQSQAVALGQVDGLAGRRLVARFGFGYDYDAERRVVTVTGPDVASSGSTSVSTTVEGLPETSVQRLGGAGFPDDELASNPSWNHLDPQAPGLREHVDGLLHQVNAQTLHALEQQPDLTVQVRTQPTAAAAEVLAEVLVRYRGGELAGFQRSDEPTRLGEDTVSLRSVWGGEVTLSYAESFANVIGSTDDPHIGGLSWIRLWAGQFGVYPVICTSYRSYGFGCGEDLVGGHVIGGTIAKQMPRGSDAVWIFPICVAHNNDDHVSMQGLRYLKGVWLRNYLGR